MNEGGSISAIDAVSDGSHGRKSARVLTTEVIFETLSNRRRRYALHYLRQVEEPVTIRDLAEQIAAWEHHVERSAVTPKLRKRVYTALHQTHLRKMDRDGIVDYNTDRGTVELNEPLDEFDIYLDVVPADEIPWSQYYLAMGATFTALATVGALGIWPFSAVGGFGYALLTSLAVTVVGASHTVRHRDDRIGARSLAGKVSPPSELEEEIELPSS